MEELVNNVLAYILTLAPTITSIISFIVSAIVTIKKVKASGKENLDAVNEIYTEVIQQNKEILEQTEELRKNLDSVITENRELKKRLAAIDPSKVRGE